MNVSDHETAAALGAAVTKMHGMLVQIAQPENVSVPFAELVFRDIRIRKCKTIVTFVLTLYSQHNADNKPLNLRWKSHW